MASDLITSWQREGGKVETVTDFISLVSKITVDGECSHKIKGCLFLGRKAVTNLGKGKESEVAQPCPTFATPWTAAHQASLSITNSGAYSNSCPLSWCDAIQPSHPLSSPSPPAFSLVQLQGLSQGVSSSHQVAKVLELQLQHHSFQ